MKRVPKSQKERRAKRRIRSPREPFRPTSSKKSKSRSESFPSLSSSKMDQEAVKTEDCSQTVLVDLETTCWGCGLRILLASYSPTFKCGWCGAITNQEKSARKPDSVWFSQWRRLRDQFFIVVLFFFMAFVICAGVWAVYPVVFSVSYFCGIFHCTVTAVLSVITILSFCLAAFRSAGAQSNVVWGSYPIVGKSSLDNYTFCAYCGKPKSPRAHHCRSCKMCVLDMDHHCPFIGNCVGAANHRAFILFLISIVVSCSYITMMTIYAGYHVWPPLDYGDLTATGLSSLDTMGLLKLILYAFASSTLLLSARGFVLVYLAFASLSIEIGISVLLWQQLHFIYEGNTYINSLSSESGGDGEKGCHNLVRLFGCPYSISRFLLGSVNISKLQQGLSSKLL